MKRILFALAIVTLLTQSKSFSQNTSNSKDNPEAILHKFFDLYEQKGSEEALEYIFSTNEWMKESEDQVDNVKLKLGDTKKLLGKYYGNELLTKKTISKLTLYTYLIKYDRQPLRFSILFYKPKDQWRLQNFSFDDNIDAELSESAKISRLRELYEAP